MPPDAEQREQRIFEAAARLISHYGYDKTSVDDIAREAGVSKGAIYLHFKSKEELFVALVLHESALAMRKAATRLEADPEGGTFYGLYGYLLVETAANPLLRAVISENKRLIGDAILRRFRDSPEFAQWRTYSVEVVQQFQAAGLLRQDLTPEMLVYMLSVFRYGILVVEDYLPPAYHQSLEDLAGVLPDIIQRALAPEGGGDKAIGRQIIARMAAMTEQMVKQMRP